MKSVAIGALLVTFGVLTAFAQPVPTPAWRPVYHFTPPQNWTNDPNGLIYRNGEYHLFYQHNPFENKWGHMSWGHAVSRDLVRWKHLPVAIPESIKPSTTGAATGSDTTWIFSGSAVWDRTNSGGFGKNGGSLVAIYTAHQPNRKRESQFVAYSRDNGMTWTDYDQNPVIDLNKKDFRDPNVFWHAPTRQWIMAVTLPAERMVQFYGSPNLRQWTLLSEFGQQGDVAGIWECPALLSLPVDGQPDRTKWVLLVSTGFSARGASMQYFVGDFDGKTFTNGYPDRAPMRVDDGFTFYAAIPWNDAPDGRKILLGWLVPGGRETSPWKGQMSIPRDLSLRTTPDGIRLVQQPNALVRQTITNATGRPLTRRNQVINNTEISLAEPSQSGRNARWIEVEFEPGSAQSFGVNVAQKGPNGSATGQRTVVGYDAAAKQLYVDRSRSGKGLKPDGQYAVDRTGLEPRNGRVKLQILLDGSSLEVFGNDGQNVITAMIYPDDDATGLSLFAQGGTATVRAMAVWDVSGLNADVAQTK